MKRICKVEGCEQSARTLGWCGMHYVRWKRHGDPLINKRPNRGTRRAESRYISVYRPGHVLANTIGWVPEHRLVAYEAGLLVDLSDLVHHRDGDKHNNAVSNLEVMSPNEHVRMHSVERAALRPKTHCPKGHPYDEENTYIPPAGGRVCRACVRQRGRVWYRKTKGRTECD